MTREEAKTILLLYRPGTADAADPQIAEALSMVSGDPELEAWHEKHAMLHETFRGKFRQIAPPAGLKEQIISARQPAPEKVVFLPRYIALAAAAVIVALIAVASLWLRPHRPNPETFAEYQGQMISVAQRAYAMDLATSDSAKIHSYLSQTNAPDFALPAGMKGIAMTGCAIENWQGAKVSMVCFNTGKRRLAAGQSSDVWLFVVDNAAVPASNASASPRLDQVNRVATAIWTEDGKLYLLATLGDKDAIKHLL